MNYTTKFLYTALLAGAIGMTSCSEDEEPGLEPAEVKTVSDLAANTDDYTFLDLETGAVLSKPDSNTVSWDIAFKGTTILFNGGNSGPGEGSAQLLDGIFDEITSAPTSGYSVDSEESLAVSTGGGNGWYNYTGPTGTPAHAILPVPGKVIAMTTGEGAYAKVEIISYYQGNPDTTTEEFASLETRPASQYFTIRYAVIENGGSEF